MSSLAVIREAYSNMGDNIDGNMEQMFNGEVINLDDSDEAGPSEHQQDISDTESMTSTIDYLPDGPVDSIEDDFLDPRGYKVYLKSLEPEIDAYRATRGRGPQTDDMIRYAQYDWVLWSC